MSELKPVLDRRRIIAAGAALLGTAALPRAGAAADEGLASAADLLGKVRAFLSGLEPDKRKAASFAWNGSEWRGWNYFGATGYVKPGLRLEQMSAAQKEAAWNVLGAVWSPSGVAKARNVMLLQDILAASGNGAGQRSSERFSLAVFGTPAETGTWGFRCEGHHLTQSVAVRDGRIVSVTPIVVLRNSEPRQIRAAHRPQHAQGRRRSGAAADGRPVAETAGQGADRRTRRPITFCPTPAASAPTPRRSGCRPPSCRRRSANCCGRWSSFIRSSIFRRSFPPAQRGARAIRRPAGRAFRLVCRQHAGDGVRLSGDRRRLRHRDGVGGRRGAAPAHDLSRSWERAGAAQSSASGTA